MNEVNGPDGGLWADAWNKAFPFRGDCTQCPAVPSVLPSGGEIHNVWILVSCCKFIYGPAFTQHASLFLFSPKATFDLAARQPAVAPSEYSDLSFHALDTRHTADSSLGEWRVELLSLCVGAFVTRTVNAVIIRYLTLSSYCIAVCHLDALCVILCYFVLYPVRLTTPDQATHYRRWHEPPCNFKVSHSFSLSLPSVTSFNTFYSALSPPLPPKCPSIWALPSWYDIYYSYTLHE